MSAFKLKLKLGKGVVSQIKWGINLELKVKNTWELIFLVNMQQTGCPEQYPNNEEH